MLPVTVRRVAAAMAASLVLAVVALVFDAADRRIPFSVLGTGLLDEPAHLATAALGLLAVCPVVRFTRPFVVGALVASVAIDLDHLPLYLGVRWVAPGGMGRPFTHSLATVAVLGLGAAVLRSYRAPLAGAAAGLVLHLGRDIAEGVPGVPLLWPVSDHPWMAGPAAWLGLVVGLVVVRLVLVTFVTVTARAEPVRPGDRSIVGERAGAPGLAETSALASRTESSREAAVEPPRG